VKKQICFVAPYDELMYIAEEAKLQLDVEFDIKKGNLEESIFAADEAKQYGYQVIISRGGTASIIKNYINIPVVEIKVTGYDLLKSLYPLKKLNETIGIIGYSNVVEGCKTIGYMIGMDIKEVRIPNDEQNIDWNGIQKQVTEMIDHHGIKEILGDTTVFSRLKLPNIHTHFISSGKESVMQAIEEAQHIFKVREKDKENARKTQAVLDCVHDAVIACDEFGKLTVFNPVAEKIFNLSKDKVIGRPIEEVIDYTGIPRVLESGQAEIDQLQDSGNGHIMTSRIPITVGGQIKGVVATFQEISKIQGTEYKIRRNLYTKGFTTRYTFDDFLTADKRMDQIICIAKGYAKTNATILIEGESGTGKEILAQSIHHASDRKDAPFVAVNCAALPPQLLESELFGYVDGAFTGAKKGGKMGLFELAHNGTIFLDEIGEMDKGLQTQLLRVLEEKQVMRLGSDRIIPIDVRVIAATNVDLRKESNNGNFRLDLYYRLNVLKLHTIPLRERKEDIRLLSNHFIGRNNIKYRTQVEPLDEKIIQMLTAYHWPGNIRELKNIIERIVLSTEKKCICLKDIDLIIDEFQADSFDYSEQNRHVELLNGSMKEIKYKIIKQVLEQENFNKSRTAKRLGIDRSTIERILHI